MPDVFALRLADDTHALLPRACAEGSERPPRENPAGHGRAALHHSRGSPGAADDTGRPWASLLTGPPGSVAVRADGSLHVVARSGPEDPRAEALGRPSPVGTIALQADTRRRMRVNGRATPTERGFRLTPDQVYADCRSTSLPAPRASPTSRCPAGRCRGRTS